MQKHANLVDLVKSFPTNIYLQNLASIQPRTSLLMFEGGGVGMGVSGMVFVGLVLGCIEAKFCK